MIKKTLDNGLTVVLKEDKRSPLLTVQAWVKAGSLDEREDEKGMAHLLEHMLFKGTEKRAVGEIARTVESCGGGINAYTTFDRTVFYLTVSKDHAATGSEILADAIFHSSFDPTELEKEKEVVVEEIRRSLDNPAALVGRRIFANCFAGCEAARPIIGSEESVRGFSRDIVTGFHARWYQPENITVVAVGNFDETEMLKAIASDFGQQPSVAVPEKPPVTHAFPKAGHTELLTGDYKQPRLEIVLPAARLEDSDSILLDVAAFALGNGDSSRLTRELRDNLQYAAAIGSSVYSPAFGGVFSISVYPILDKYEDCVEEIGRVFGELKYTSPITTEELAKARANLKADYCYQQETIDGLAKSLGYGLTTKYAEYYEDVYMGAVEKADAPSIQAAVNNWLNEEQVVIVGMVPEGTSISDSKLRERFLVGVEKAKQKPAQAVVTASAKDPVSIELKPGIKIAYRQIPEAQFMSLIAVTEGGLRAETHETAGFHHVVAQLWGKQSSGYSYDDILEKVDGMGATIDGFSGKDSFGLRLHCLTEQWPEILPYFVDAMQNPEFPDVQWQTTLNEINEQINSENDTPSSVAFRKFQELIFADHPYRLPVYGNKDSVEKFNKDAFLKQLKKERDSGPWVLGVVGPRPLEQIKADLENSLDWWKPAQTPRPIKDGSKLPLPKAHAETISKKREQTHIVAGFRGVNWQDKDREACDVLGLILGGQGGRLFYELRDQQSLAYAVSAVSNHGKDPGVFAGYIATAPDKAEHALAALQKELFNIAETPPTDVEVSRAINVLIGNHGEDLQRTNSQALTMGLMELYGLGAGDFLAYTQRLKDVTPEKVQAVAQRLFNKDHLVVVQVG